MGLIELNKNPSPRQLFWFGAMFAMFFGLVGGLIWWRADGRTVAFVLWPVAGFISLTFYVLPPIRKPLYLGWTYLFYPIGWVVTHVLMVLIYYGVFTPIGLLMRLFGHDPLERRLDRAAATYWVDHESGVDPARYFRQF